MVLDGTTGTEALIDAEEHLHIAATSVANLRRPMFARHITQAIVRLLLESASSTPIDSESAKSSVLVPANYTIGRHLAPCLLQRELAQSHPAHCRVQHIRCRELLNW
jgi:hypothetical protein